MLATRYEYPPSLSQLINRMPLYRIVPGAISSTLSHIERLAGVYDLFSGRCSRWIITDGTLRTDWFRRGRCDSCPPTNAKGRVHRR